MSLPIRRRAGSPAAVAVCFAAAFANFGCTAGRPPERVQDAIRTIRRHLRPYVAEANRALQESSHPDAERLVGTGERLVKAVDSLERWATDPAPPSSASTAPTGGEK